MKRGFSAAAIGESNKYPTKKPRDTHHKNGGQNGIGSGNLMNIMLSSLIGGSGGGLGETFKDMFGGKDDVMKEHNHIYFKTEVTFDSIKKLSDIIIEINRDYERMSVDDTSNFVFPKPVYLHISSIGGDLLAGFLGYDVIRNSKVPIYTVADGYAVSSGSIMFMAGKKRFMTSNSYLLIHQLNQSICDTLNYNNVLDISVNDIELMKRTYQIYLDGYRHGYSPVPREYILTKEKLEEHMAHDIYWNFQTCFQYGLADGIYVNYQEREEQDRQDFNRKITGGLVKLPTYAEITGSFEHEHSVLFEDRDKYTPSPEVQKQICVLAQKNIDTRKNIEQKMNQSNLGRLLNSLNTNGAGDNNAMNVDLNDVVSDSLEYDYQDNQDNQDNATAVINTKSKRRSARIAKLPGK